MEESENLVSQKHDRQPSKEINDTGQSGDSATNVMQNRDESSPSLPNSQVVYGSPRLSAMSRSAPPISAKTQESLTAHGERSIKLLSALQEIGVKIKVKDGRRGSELGLDRIFDEGTGRDLSAAEVVTTAIATIEEFMRVIGALGHDILMGLDSDITKLLSEGKLDKATESYVRDTFGGARHEDDSMSSPRTHSSSRPGTPAYGQNLVARAVSGLAKLSPFAGTGPRKCTEDELLLLMPTDSLTLTKADKLMGKRRVAAGWMDKKGPAGFPWCFASITKRFFVLDHANASFTYFKSEGDAIRGATPRGIIDLRVVCCVRWSSDGTAPRHAIDLVIRKRKEAINGSGDHPPVDKSKSFSLKPRSPKKVGELEVERIHTVVPLMSNKNFEIERSLSQEELSYDERISRRAVRASPTFVGVTEEYAAHWCKCIVDALEMHSIISPAKLSGVPEAEVFRLVEKTLLSSPEKRAVVVDERIIQEASRIRGLGTQETNHTSLPAPTAKLPPPPEEKRERQGAVVGRHSDAESQMLGPKLEVSSPTVTHHRSTSMPNPPISPPGFGRKEPSTSNPLIGPSHGESMNIALRAGRVPSDLHSGVAKMLQNRMHEWNFDVFDLDLLCGRTQQNAGRPMVLMGSVLLGPMNYNLITECALEEATINTFLGKIDDMYNNDNPYHNSLHAADVAQTLNYMLSRGGFAQILQLTQDQVLASLLAALVHDVGHPGVNNAFLCATSDPLALRYNDRSPLENFHCSVPFEMMRNEALDIFAGFDFERRRGIRHLIVEMVLATDNAHHMTFLGQLKAKIELNEVSLLATEGELEVDRVDIPVGHDTQILFLQMVLHASDVSNPAKKWSIYSTWTSRVMEEFYAQGDRERELGMVVTPFLDRTKPIPAPMFQSGFINAIVSPLFSLLNSLDGACLAECTSQLHENLQYWKQLEEDQSCKDKE